MYTITSMWHS